MLFTDFEIFLYGAKKTYLYHILNTIVFHYFLINHTINFRNRIKLSNQQDDIHVIFKSTMLTRDLFLRSKK